jgi:hypothetical protein
MGINLHRQTDRQLIFLLYLTPGVFVRKHSEAKIIMANNSLSTSVMRVGLLLLATLSLFLSKMRPGMGRWPIGKDALGGVDRYAVGFGRTVVLCRPFHGHFMWPLDVVGLAPYRS